MNQKIILAIVGVFLLAAFYFGAKAYNASQVQPPMTNEEISRLSPAHSIKLGGDNPKVVLVEFFDPACGTCARFSPLIKELVKKYDGKLQLVMRNAPFHQNSEVIVAMIEASRAQNKYWETLEVLFQNQDAWTHNHVVYPERAWRFIESVGVDIVALRDEMKKPHILENMMKDIDDVEALKVEKTPSFFVNGKPLERFGYEPLVELIESQMR